MCVCVCMSIWLSLCVCPVDQHSQGWSSVYLNIAGPTRSSLHLCTYIQTQPCRPFYVYIGGSARKIQCSCRHNCWHSWPLVVSCTYSYIHHHHFLHSFWRTCRYFIIIPVLFVRVHHYHHGGWNAVCTLHQAHFYKRPFPGCQLYWYILHRYTHVSNCSRYTIYLGHLLVGAVPNQAMNIIINFCGLGILCAIIHCSHISLGPIGGT